MKIRGGKMKKVNTYLFFVLLVLILAVSGCSSGGNVDENSNVNDDSKVDNDKPSIDDNDEEVIGDLQNGLPSDVVTLLKKGQEKLKNIQYEHRRFPDNQELHIISILGDKMVYVLPESQAFMKDEYFDTVYLDIPTGTAVAYCEHKGDQKCPEPNKAFRDIDFFIGMVLYDDWVDKIIDGTNYIKRDQETLFDRKVDVFDVDINGVTHRISVDQFYGVPLKIEKYPDSDVDGSRPAEEYTYRIISVGKLGSADM